MAEAFPRITVGLNKLTPAVWDRGASILERAENLDRMHGQDRRSNEFNKRSSPRQFDAVIYGWRTVGEAEPWTTPNETRWLYHYAWVERKPEPHYSIPPTSVDAIPPNIGRQSIPLVSPDGIYANVHASDRQGEDFAQPAINLWEWRSYGESNFSFAVGALAAQGNVQVDNPPIISVDDPFVDPVPYRTVGAQRLFPAGTLSGVFVRMYYQTGGISAADGQEQSPYFYFYHPVPARVECTSPAPTL